MKKYLPKNNLPATTPFLEWSTKSILQNNLRGCLFQEVSAGLIISISLFIIMSCFAASFIYAEDARLVKLTQEERTWLDLNREKLVLLFNPSFPPMEFSSPSGEFSGMSADIIAMIEKRLGLSFIKRPSDNWGKNLSSLEKGECALVPTIAYTADREHFVYFTPSYAMDPVVIIGTQALKTGTSLKDLSGKRVAAVGGFATEKYLRSLPGSRFKIVPVPNVIQGLRATSFGQVDAFIEDLGIASYYIDKESIVNLRVVGDTDFFYLLSIGVSRKYPLLFSAIQKAFVDIPLNDLEKVRKQWISLKAHNKMSPETKRLLILIALFVVLLLLGFAGISYFLRRRLKEKIINLKKAEQELADQKELLGLVLEATQAGFWDNHISEQTVYLSDQWWMIIGCEPQNKKISLAQLKEFIHPDDLAVVERTFEDYFQNKGHGRFETEFRLRRANGTWCWVYSKGKTIEWDKNGFPLRIIGLDLNIQEFKEIREKMIRSEENFHTLFKMTPLPLANISLDGNILELNNSLIETMGYTIDDVPTLEDVWRLSMPDPDIRNRAISEWKENLKHAIAESSDVKSFECPLLCKDGILRTMVIVTKILKDSIIVCFFDITEHKRNEEAIDFERKQLLSIFDSLNEAFYVSDPFTYEVLFANRHLRQLAGKDPTAGICYREFQGLDAPCDFCTNNIILKNNGAPHRWEHHNSLLNIDIAIVDKIIKWPDGRDVRFEFAIDITERKKAERDREKLQEQLLQSRKMEAVGILAGGIAHDFNNILGVIIGYAEIALNTMDPQNPLCKNLNKIIDAANRSANITRQLLGFARKQTITPIAIDINESIETMLKMIRRLIGENIDLSWMPGSESCIVRMDPSQLDQILVNLSVNARDAINDVGRITIETGKTSFDKGHCETHAGFMPGNYALLSFSDNGCGINKKDMEHIFEPFFTTKDIGRGTGMGLATVYGIVKQNKGFINAYSEPGTGTTFKIYIPVNIDDAALTMQESAGDIPCSQGETVLIVEDDPAILEMSIMMLQHLGYSFLSARTPGEAISMVYEIDSEIHLLITDVIMPEMNGRDLADRISAIRPNIKRLFMSGYTANIIAHQGVLGRDVFFIQKPFSLEELAVKIREAIK